MSPEWITILLVGTFITLLVLGLPLAWSMGATAVIFTLGLFGPSTMFMTMTRVYHMMLNYTLVSVPLFVFMGFIFERYIYLDVSLVYAVISFVGLVAIARFLEKGI